LLQLLSIILCVLFYELSRLTLHFNFSYQVVESMRLGMEPKIAAKDAIARITKKFPDFVGAVVALNKMGEHAGACHGWTFKYSVRSPAMKDVKVFTVLP
jgi:N4-(beta-N-acetylglucosaminyl)-L-asparaginase